MKNIILCAVLMLAVGAAEARTTKTTKTSTNKSKFDVRVPVKKWIRKMNNGFRVGIGQGTLGTNIRARKNGIDESTNGTRSTKMQLQAGWEKIETNEIGYSAFFTYQDIAEALQTEGSNDKEDVRSMRWSGNATYGITDQVYTYGGLNLNKFYGSEEIEANFERGIGYQAGLGFMLHKKANLEIEYLSLVSEGRTNGINVDIAAKGVMLKLNTPISFDI